MIRTWWSWWRTGLLVVGEGTVRPFEGDLSDYRALISETGSTRGAKRAEKPASAVRDERRERAAARAAMEPLRKRAKEAEARLARLADERKTIETALADPKMYRNGKSADVARENARLAAVGRAVAAAEADWLEAASALEAAEAG